MFVLCGTNDSVVEESVSTVPESTTSSTTTTTILDTTTTVAPSNSCIPDNNSNINQNEIVQKGGYVFNLIAFMTQVFARAVEAIGKFLVASYPVLFKFHLFKLGKRPKKDDEKSKTQQQDYPRGNGGKSGKSSSSGSSSSGPRKRCEGCNNAPDQQKGDKCVLETRHYIFSAHPDHNKSGLWNKFWKAKKYREIGQFWITYPQVA